MMEQENMTEETQSESAELDSDNGQRDDTDVVSQGWRRKHNGEN